jgi:hypothetical protein
LAEVHQRLLELSERAENALLNVLRDEATSVRIQAIETLNTFEMSPNGTLLTRERTFVTSSADSWEALGLSLLNRGGHQRSPSRECPRQQTTDRLLVVLLPQRSPTKYERKKSCFCASIKETKKPLLHVAVM